MSLHNEIQRRKKYNCNKELDEAVDDIKTERFLDKEDVDAPITVTKEQLMAKRRENNGVEDYEPPANSLSNKLFTPVLIAFLISIAAVIILQKIFTVFYYIALFLLMFALTDVQTNQKTGAKEKVSTLSRVIFGLFSLASLALAIYLTIKWK